MDGGDDLFGVDALQVDRGRAEVGVGELALDHVERHAFAGELDGVGVAELVRREAAPDARLGGEPAELTRMLALDGDGCGRSESEEPID